MSTAVNPKREVFENLARIGTALSSAVRLDLLELLAQGERSVDELATLTGATVANTSQHLQKLKQVGLIVGRKEAQFVRYRLAGDEVDCAVQRTRCGRSGLSGRRRSHRAPVLHVKGRDGARARRGAAAACEERPRYGARRATTGGVRSGTCSWRDQHSDPRAREGGWPNYPSARRSSRTAVDRTA